MTIKEMKQWEDGKNLWYLYTQINGYAFNPTDKGLHKLATVLKLKKSYIAQRINLFLEN